MFGFIGLEHLLFILVIITRYFLTAQPGWVDVFLQRRTYRKKNKHLVKMFSTRVKAKMGGLLAGALKKKAE